MEVLSRRGDQGHKLRAVAGTLVCGLFVGGNSSRRKAAD